MWIQLLSKGPCSYHVGAGLCQLCLFLKWPSHFLLHPSAPFSVWVLLPCSGCSQGCRSFPDTFPFLWPNRVKQHCGKTLSTGSLCGSGSLYFLSLSALARERNGHVIRDAYTDLLPLKLIFCDLNVLLVCQEALTKSLKAFRLRSYVFSPCVIIPHMVISNSKYSFNYIDSFPKPSLFWDSLTL